MRTAVCTISSNNYLAYSKNLLRSLRARGDTADRFLLIVDRLDTLLIEGIDDVVIVALSDLGIPEIRDMAFKYNIVELNTSVKPFLLNWILDKGYDAALYLDPDTMAFAPLDPLYAEFEKCSLLLTPHVLHDSEGGILEVNAFSCNGIFNLGFFGVKNDAIGRSALDWWARKLVDHCYLDYVRGLATDQKWADYFPSLFDRVGILKNPGCNMAIWNLHERVLSPEGDGYRVNGMSRLLFYHFSGYNPGMPDLLLWSKGFKLDTRPDLAGVYASYREGVGLSQGRHLEYFFGKYTNGQTILPEHRIIYSIVGSSLADPFSTNAGSFFQWLRNRRLARPSKIARKDCDTRQAELQRVLGDAGNKPGNPLALSMVKAVRTRPVASRVLLFMARLIGPVRFFKLMGAMRAAGNIRHFAGLIR